MTLSLLNLDVQFAGTAVILWLKKGISYWTNLEIVVVSVGFFITITWLLIGYLSVSFLFSLAILNFIL